MTKDEAKWVAYKLYRHARDHFDRQQPKEKRILEYLLTIRDQCWMWTMTSYVRNCMIMAKEEIDQKGGVAA